MRRTASELRQAAIDSGWGNDALAEEIIAALVDADAVDRERMAELETLRAQLAARDTSTHGRVDRRPPWVAALFGAGVVAAALGGVIFAQSVAHQAALTRADQEATRLTAAKEAEIARLREASDKQNTLLAERLQSALSVAAKIGETNESLSGVYTSSIKDLLGELKQARSGVGQGTSVPPTKP